MPDLDWREIAMLAPLVVVIGVVGVYPQPFLSRIEPSAQRVVTQLRTGSVLPNATGVAEGP